MALPKIAATALVTGLFASCASPGLRSASSQLAPWTSELRDQQPEDAFAAAYRVGKRHLVFVAALHENRTDSATFKMIGDAYARFDIDVVLAEGFPTSRGPNPRRLMEYALEEARDGFQEGGETVPVVAGAVRAGATVWGGEPDDVDVKARVIAQGFSTEDVLGYYVLRVVPQWIRERKIEHAGDPRLRPLVEEELGRQRRFLRLDSVALPGFEQWASWYQKLNGKPLDATFTTEEAGPLQNGPFATNKVAAAVSRARDTFLHELIIQHLKSGNSVLVVFGGSHLMIQRPALDAALGAPCHVAQTLTDAAERCRSEGS